MKLALKHLKTNQSLEIIPFNREVKSNKALRDSLRKYGFMDSIKVIETSLFGKNKGLYIVDAQHRYYEGKILELEIPYTIVAKTDKLSEIVDIMSIYNNTGRKWVNDDYANCYCAIGKSEYLYLRAKRGETKLSYAALLNIYCGGDNGQCYKRFREGNIKLNIESGDILLKYSISLFKIKSLSERSLRAFIPFVKSINNYDNDKFLRNLKYSLPLLDDCLETTQFYDKFVEVYNK